MSDATDKNVFGMVLAAGAGSRFGATKQLATIDGTTLVQKSHDIAIETCGSNSVLVVGHDWQAVWETCQPSAGFLVVNENHASGLGTSIAQAVRSVQHIADAIIVLLADQVLVTSEHAQALLAAWDGAQDHIVATFYSDTVGAPVLFPGGCFADLATLEGDSGGRQLLSDERFHVTEIEFEPAAVDIDTPDDLKQISRNVRN